MAGGPDRRDHLRQCGSLGVDVTAANACNYVGVCGDGLSPIVFDADGSITDALLRRRRLDSVLGFAAPECGTFVPPRITEASAVLNGKFIDGIPSAEQSRDQSLTISPASSSTSSATT